MRARSNSRRLWAVACAACLTAMLVSLLGTLAVRQAVAAQRSARGGTAGQTGAALRTWERDAAWFQRLIYVYASGNLPIQRSATASGVAAGLRPDAVVRIASAVRAAWVRMMTADPAELGRLGVKPNLVGEQNVLTGLRRALQGIAGPHYGALLSATEATYRMVANPAWLRAQGMAPAVASRSSRTTSASSSTALVYATSFRIPLYIGGFGPGGRAGTPMPAPTQVGYVALPDAYVKFANLREYSAIPSLYQSFYLPQGTATPHFTVDIATSAGNIVDRGVPVEDVGPWNEDDNWWDPTDPTANIPASCPVSQTLVSPQSLSNAQVDGICPGSSNWRRFAYYLLYQHGGTPFFQPSAYAPTGTYADATAWPPVLPQYCPEASAASVNNDGATCVGSLAGYNGNAGCWLRDGTYNTPVLNQSGIDLDPIVDAALGWQWPSSGFIQVNVSRLP
jgi:hypothetical protein